MNERTLELPAVTGLSDSKRYELLANDRRRHTLDVLADRDLPLTLDEIAEAVAAREVDATDSRPGTLKDVKITLHHVHLPKLAEADVVDYDPTFHRITEYQRDVELQRN